MGNLPASLALSITESKSREYLEFVKLAPLKNELYHIINKSNHAI